MHGQGGQVEAYAPHVKGAHDWPALKQIRMVAHLHRHAEMRVQRQCENTRGGADW